MTFNTLQKDCAAESWESVEPLIHDTIRKFKQSHGGDYEDLFDISVNSYIKAFQSFDPAAGRTFPSWVRYYVWTDLFNHFLDTLNNKKRHQIWTEERSSEACHNCTFLTDFLDELTDDAKTIVHLILTTPDDFQFAVKQAGGELKKVKSVIYTYLRKLGWQRKRILNTYRVIEKALE